jgi:Arc/MetJ family transcription regulator
MSRTNIDIDDEMVAEVMRRFGLDTKKSAVELALRRLLDATDQRKALDRLMGVGWEGDLDQMRGWEPGQ